VECVRDKRDTYRDLVGEPDGKGTLGRARYKWEANIKIHSFCSLSYDRSVASSKASSPQGAI
jgi:hypothetical protein